ncbi:MAG: YHS domain-containing (seleno)protein [Betaproteobacteria bacterium]
MPNSLPLPLASRLAALLAALAALLALAARAAPYDTIADGADARLMLKGHDPVAFFATGKPTPGGAGVKTDFDGVTYRFASDGNRLEFLKNPLKYVPQFGGYCANGMLYAMPWPGVPDAWKIIEGRLYVFADERQRRYFLMDEEGNLPLARGYWRDEAEGGIALVQRYRRLLHRVPHYRTDKELEAEWRSKNDAQ